MKNTLLLFLFFSTQAFSQTFEVIEFADSLVIRDENIATNSFPFGDNPLRHLNQLKPLAEKELFENNHVEGKIDTIHHLTIGQNKFSVFHDEEDGNFLLSAQVVTKDFKTKHGIFVGLKKSEVIKLLKKYNVKKLPDCVVFENSEIYEYLIIRFKNGAVTQITFSGYYD